MFQHETKDKTHSEKSKTHILKINKDRLQTETKIPAQMKSLFTPSPNTKDKQQSSPPGEQNNTGIPLQMKREFESLSKFSFDDVRVHYNSEKPAKLQALAYTQGNHVYIGSGNERHLGHELGHVVQQKQGRVKTGGMLDGQPVNTDASLEHEADAGLFPASPQGLGNGYGSVVQRLAANPAADLPAVENRSDLTPGTVNDVMSGTINQNDAIITPMTNQKNWIAQYHAYVHNRSLLQTNIKNMIDNIKANENVKPAIDNLQTPPEGSNVNDLRQTLIDNVTANYNVIDAQAANINTVDGILTDHTQFNNINTAKNNAQTAKDNLNTANAVEGIAYANTFLTQATAARSAAINMAGSVVNDSAAKAQEAFRSAVNLSKDLYIIREKLETTAEGDANIPQVVTSSTLANKKAVISNIKTAYPTANSSTAGLDNALNFKIAVAGQQAMSKGKKLIRAVKTQPGFDASNLQQSSKMIARLYRDAGALSNESRLLSGDTQRKAGMLKGLLPGVFEAANQAHTESEGNEKMKTQVGILNKRHGPALAEVDIMRDDGTRESTISRINDPLGRIPKKLHPLIANDLAKMGPGGDKSETYHSYLSLTKGAGSHAEVYAANKALIHKRISTKEEAADKLFGRVAKTPQGGPSQGGQPVPPVNVTAIDLPSFAQCPHCSAALQTASPAIFKSHRTYVEKCAYYIKQEIAYAPRSDTDVWNCAHALMDLSNWNVNVMASYIHGLTQSTDNEANYYAAVHLFENIELKKYHIAYHH